MRILLGLLAVCSLAVAQTALPTDFPADAVPFQSDALRQRLTGKVFIVKPVSDPQIRFQFRERDAFSNSGNRNNHGPWRVEGSAVCIDWAIGQAVCSEVRLVGETIYWKRGNGEVAVLQPQ
jgi:hypothetical protein